MGEQIPGCGQCRLEDRALFRSRFTYTLDPDNTFKSGTIPPINADVPILSDGSKAKTKAKTLIATDQTVNYVISLPIPKYFTATTYDIPGSPIDGYSESKVWQGGATAALAQGTPPAVFTTTMVLHYGAGAIPKTFTVNTVNGSGSISTAPTSGPPGITIVAGSLDQNPAHMECDDISLMSFNEREGLWNTGHSALFPVERDKEGHQSHRYDYKCVGKDVRGTNRSGGSGDCHMAQMDLNLAIPGEKIIP